MVSDAGERLHRFVTAVDGLGIGTTLRVGPTTEAGWCGWGDAALRTTSWHARLISEGVERRAAAMRIAEWTSSVPALVVGLPAVLADVAVDGDEEAIAVHRHPDGWFDGHAIQPVNVGARPDLLGWAGRRIAALTAPTVDRLSDELPIGRGVLWGAVADALAGRAVWLAGRLGTDQQRAWSRTQVVFDAVASTVGDLRHRPTPYPVTFSGGSSLHQVRGTCCLYYRTQPAADPDGEGYCVTCPLRTDASRTRRLRAHLESASS